MSIKRIYDNWSQVTAATGTPGSARRRAWGGYLATRPAIAYWGDSWFSTPLYRNLYWNSFARIDGASRMPVDAAYQAVVDDGVFARVRERYAILLSALSTVGGGFRVVGHGYAPLQRIGAAGATSIKNLGLAAPLVGNVGPWLWPAMRPVLGTHEAARAFARRLLVDGFRDQVLVPSRRDFGGLFSFVDFAGIPDAAADAFWYDEIHPTEAGFAVRATGLNPLLRAALPAAKRAAVRG